MDVGDEAVDAGVDAGRLPAVDISVRRDEVSQHLQIRKPARVAPSGG